VSTLGLRCGYRYEIHPLSDLFRVYTPGAAEGSLTDRSESLPALHSRGG